MEYKLLHAFLNHEKRPEVLLSLLNSFKVDTTLLNNKKILELIKDLPYLSKANQIALLAKFTDKRVIIEDLLENGSRHTLRFLAKNRNLNRHDTQVLINKAINLKESSILISLVESWPEFLLEILRDSRIYPIVSFRKGHPFQRAIYSSLSSPEFQTLEDLEHTISALPEPLGSLVAEQCIEVFSSYVSGLLEFDIKKTEYLAKIITSNQRFSLSPRLETSLSFYSRVRNAHPSQGNPYHVFKALGLNLGVYKELAGYRPIIDVCQPNLHYKLPGYVSESEESVNDAHAFSVVIKKFEEKSIKDVINFLTIESSLIDELIAHSSFIRKELLDNIELIKNSTILSSLINSEIDRSLLLSKFEKMGDLSAFITGQQALNLFLNFDQSLSDSLLNRLLLVALGDESSARRAVEFIVSLPESRLEKLIIEILTTPNLERYLRSKVFNELFQDSALSEHLMPLLPFVPLKEINQDALSTRATEYIARRYCNSNPTYKNYEIFLRILPDWEGSIEQLAEVSRSL